MFNRYPWVVRKSSCLRTAGFSRPLVGSLGGVIDAADSRILGSDLGNGDGDLISESGVKYWMRFVKSARESRGRATETWGN